MTDAPTLYLGYAPSFRGFSALGDGPSAIPPEQAPSLLVSFLKLKLFLGSRSRMRLRTWCLDSGAFSAWNSGATIALDDYIRACQELLATDPALTEVFALDVIGNWRQSLLNAEAMWRAGVPAIPTYHLGEPEDVLLGLARDYPKIALGGMALEHAPKKARFVEQCFARVWPKPIHGLGVGSRDLMLRVPWHSVDVTSWETGPCRFGRWRAFNNARLGIRGARQDLRVELRWYQELERVARHRWRRDMAVITANWHP